ncbi:MAG: hypothetical protein QOH13_1205, partial [Thermoleophilaceae bacterium]|nr:hypothetical protein [Thermoleophilaceae bacterium]
MPAWVEERTVPDMLARCVRNAPDRVALVGDSAGRGEVELTYAELADAAARVAGGFAELGVSHGDRIALLISNHAALEGHIAVHAAHRLGAIVVPINVRSVPTE